MKRFKCTADDLVPGDLCTPGEKRECGTDPDLNNCFYQGKTRDIYRVEGPRAAVALAAHERTVERASRRKAEIDARRGLAARTAERRQRRSASTSPAPDLAARTAGRRRAASTSPARRAAPDDLAARTAERRRRAGR